MGICGGREAAVPSPMIHRIRHWGYIVYVSARTTSTLHNNKPEPIPNGSSQDGFKQCQGRFAENWRSKGRKITLEWNAGSYILAGIKRQTILRTVRLKKKERTCRKPRYHQRNRGGTYSLVHTLAYERRTARMTKDHQLVNEWRKERYIGLKQKLTSYHEFGAWTND